MLRRVESDFLSAALVRRNALRFLLGVLLLAISGRVYSQTTTWDSMLTGSQWYVPTQNLLAYITTTSDLTQNVQIGDQTLWYITNCVGGVFTGTSSQSLTTPISGGTTDTATGTVMNGVINSAGQVQINFTETNGDVTIALGNYRSENGTNLIEMQMFSQEVSGENVTHWAYMAPFTGSAYPPTTPTNPALLSTAWEWMQGTSWNLTDPDLFGSNGSGVFSISTYNSGYFYGSGTSAGSAYTLIGSATPEGNLILGLIDKTSSARTSLFGTITGTASSASMSLSNYTTLGITSGPPIATANVISDQSANLYVTSGTALSLASGTSSYAYTYVGNAANDSNNALTITNDNTLLANSQNLYVGNLGSGNTMTITNGAVVADRSGFVGYDSSSSNNSVQVTGSNSVWRNSADLYVGYSGSNNSLMITSGAQVFASNTYISSFGGSANSVQISDTGSILSNSGSIWVGASPIAGVVGTGTLTVTSGATLSAANLIISGATNSVGTVEIGLKGGSDSNMTLNIPLITFGEGTGSLGLNQSDTLTIRGSIQGATGTNSYAMIQQYGSGTTILTGTSHTGLGYRVDGGQLMVDGGIFDIYLISAIAPNELGGPRTVTVGNKNSGISLVVKNGGELHSFATIIGTDLQKNSAALTTSANNWALITDPGSKLIAGALQVGNVSSGNSLTISNGATVSSTLSTSIGISGSNNSVTVTGTGSLLTNTGSLIVGTYSQSYDSSANSLLVTNGGSVTSGSATIGNTTNSFGNSVTVSGSGSLWTNSGDVILGNGGSSNSLTIANGGGMVSSNFFISYTNTSSDNSVLVTGSSGNSSTLSNTGTLSIGFAGSGSLTVADGALVVASGGITIASQAGAVGTLNVTGGLVTNSSGILGSGTGSFGTATASSGTWANSGDLTVGGSGTGTLTMSGGLVSVGGTLSQGSYGTINLNSGGTLQIGVGGASGDLASDLTNNGTLIFNRSDASTYSGVISGTGAFTKQGGGTLTLAGANSYSGLTRISGGALALSGTGSVGTGGLSLGTGGSFDLTALTSGTSALAGNLIGSGTLSGNGKTLAVSGSFLPGNSPGTVMVDTGFLLDLSGATGTAFEITSPLFTAGSYDLVDGAGSVTFGGSLNLLFSGGIFANNANVLQLFTNAGGFAGDFASVSSTGLSLGQTATFNAATGFITIVPEPTTAALVALGAGLVGFRQRRKRRTA